MGCTLRLLSQRNMYQHKYKHIKQLEATLRTLGGSPDLQKCHKR